MISATALDDVKAFLSRKGLLVAAFTRQCIKHIGYRGDSAFDGNILPGQSNRVSAAIPFFVMSLRLRQQSGCGACRVAASSPQKPSQDVQFPPLDSDRATTWVR